MTKQKTNQDAAGTYDFRCSSCNKLLAKHFMHNTSIQIKCVRCGTINSILEDSERQIFLTDRRGTILYVNDQVLQVTGYAPEELLGKTPAVWGRQMSPDFYRQLWKTILEEKKAIAFQITNRKKSGELYEAMVRISPIVDDSGEVLHFLGIQSPLPKRDN